MQIATTNSIGFNNRTNDMQNSNSGLPKHCVSFGRFKKEFFKQLKKKYEKIQVDHS